MKEEEDAAKETAGYAAEVYQKREGYGTEGGNSGSNKHGGEKSFADA